MGGPDYSGLYTRLARGVKDRDLDLIRSAVTALDKDLGARPSLSTALDILDIIREKEEASFDRAAALWVARLILERQVGLLDVERAVDAIDVVFGISRQTLDPLIARPESAAELARPKPWIVNHAPST